MKKKTEKAHFLDQWKQMVTHLKAFIKTGDQEELHLFRVQVKKIRAMLTLLDIDSPKHKLLRDFKPVRRIFKHCGDIRNAYMNLQLGVRYRLNNEEFVLSQLNSIEKGTLEFKQQGKKYLKIINIAYNQLKDDLRAVDVSRITDFYKTQLEQIAITLTDLQFNEALHDCRKQIKTLLYNRKIAQKALLAARLQINYDYLDKLQDNIGKWHDNILAIELFSTPGVNDRAVLTKIKGQNTRLKKLITTLAEDFWKKANVDQGTSDEDSAIKII